MGRPSSRAAPQRDERLSLPKYAKLPIMAQSPWVFGRFRTALESHIEREERELLPMIRELAAARRGVDPHALASLINSLERDHDAVDSEFLKIRELTHGFVAPPNVCQTYQSLLDGLWELEMNLHQNVYEENRYLFPRAMRREAGLVAAGYGTGEE